MAAGANAVFAWMVCGDDASRAFCASCGNDGIYVGCGVRAGPRPLGATCVGVFSAGSTCHRPASRVVDWHVDVVASNVWAGFCDTDVETASARTTVD